METITLGSQWNKELIAVTAAVTDTSQQVITVWRLSFNPLQILQLIRELKLIKLKVYEPNNNYARALYISARFSAVPCKTPMWNDNNRGILANANDFSIFFVFRFYIFSLSKFHDLE